MTSPQNLNNQKGRPVEAMPLRGSGNSKRVEEEARSVHTDRHYDKSARSNNSQEKSVHSTNSQNRSVHSQASQERSMHSQKSQEKAPSDNQSQKSGSQRRERSTSSSRTGGQRYQKLSSSLVSNPDNLVCDDCINDSLGKRNKDKNADRKEADREYALRTNAQVKMQLAMEKQRHLEKLQMYRDGIGEQNQNMQALKAQQRAEAEIEKERVRIHLADNSDLIAQERMLLERKERFRGELDQQLDEFHVNQQIKQKYKMDLEKGNHNLLIDDAWRAPLKEELKQHYKNNLLQQMNEKEAWKLDAKKERLVKDAIYVEEVKEYNQRDHETRVAIEAEKKELFKKELAKQMEHNIDKRLQAEELKYNDHQRHQERIESDNVAFRGNIERKKVEVHGYLQDLTQQARDKELDKRQALADSKKPEGTGLHLPEKVKKCYNCNVCKRATALERLNKKYQHKSKVK